MKTIVFVLFFFSNIVIALAQNNAITNISTVQRIDGSMKVDITYDLVGSEPEYIIYAEVSFNNGITFFKIDSVAGDVGENVAPGIGKAFVWNFGNEFPGKYSSDTQIRLTASLVNLWFCGDTLIDSRDNQGYRTVQIGTQCWMAENLNIGTMVNGSNNQTDNDTIEKYCYNNSTSNCDTYGGLYQWNEMMGYVTTEGTQGICPTGWHLPSDAEWMVLEEEVESTTGVNWNTGGWRGTDAGGNLKETGTTHWASPNTGATNSSGFTGLPGGYRYTNGSFYDLTINAYFWSSSGDGWDAWGRGLGYNGAQVSRGYGDQAGGFGVRCVRD
jgi:uncharacterized protein (TIGR02145 family)